MSDFIITVVVTFIFFPLFLRIAFGIMRLFGIYTIVEEGTSAVYTLFGKVVATISEPGLHFLPLKIWWRAPIINFIGKRYEVDMRLDQVYLRSQPVNSEEGAPMGIGIWYEMFVSDPVAFLFKNTDPRGSLAANVSNAAVRCLSNLKLSSMLENRHQMSRAVRAEVSEKSREWGYQLGSIYIRKVHFRDHEMIRQIEAKVVNRLRQVTSAIKQDGVNQVSVITSTAEKQAAVEFARAVAIRPQIVGDALKKCAADPVVAKAMFEILECQKLIDSKSKVTLLPKGEPLMSALMATNMGSGGSERAATSTFGVG